MFFSRLKLTAPSPPFPAWTSIRASSMNFIEENKKPYRVDRALGRAACLLSRHHADRLLACRAFQVEADLAAHLRVESMVLPDPDVVAGVDAGAALANDDAAGGHQLPAETLDPETFRL